MLKFRNPGTNFVLHIQIIKGLYKKFGGQTPFSLEDMASVIAVQENLMTAYGYSRESAIQLSIRKDKSRDSAYNNAKMYAEHFRILGLITPYYTDKSYPLLLTYIGVHIATSDQKAIQLYEQCIWGINNPTELTDKVKYSENSRFLKCTLNTLVDLGGIMYKHELCMGPMSVNDEDSTEYSGMIKFINSIRGDDSRLNIAFENFSKSLKMSTVSVDNQTRMPVAFLSQFKYVEPNRNSSLYNTNKLVNKYEGLDGLKTGFTNKAGYCLVATAKRNNVRLISVVLGTEANSVRFSETRKLLDYGFLNIENYNVSKKGDLVKTVDIKKGVRKNVAAVHKDDINLTILKKDRNNVRKSIKIFNDITAPVEKGRILGTVEYKVCDNILLNRDIVAKEDVPRASFIRLFFRAILNWLGIE